MDASDDKLPSCDACISLPQGLLGWGFVTYVIFRFFVNHGGPALRWLGLRTTLV